MLGSDVCIDEGREDPPAVDEDDILCVPPAWWKSRRGTSVTCPNSLSAVAAASAAAAAFAFALAFALALALAFALVLLLSALARGGGATPWLLARRSSSPTSVGMCSMTGRTGPPRKPPWVGLGCPCPPAAPMV